MYCWLQLVLTDIVAGNEAEQSVGTHLSFIVSLSW